MVIPNVIVNDGKGEKGVSVLDTSVSEGSTERDQFLRGHDGAPPIPEPYLGVNQHSPISPITPKQY